MRHLTNYPNPDSADFDRRIDYPSDIAFEGRAEFAKHQREWALSKTIGMPKATDSYTVADLVKMNYVGLYEKED